MPRACNGEFLRDRGTWSKHAVPGTMRRFSGLLLLGVASLVFTSACLLVLQRSTYGERVLVELSEGHDEVPNRFASSTREASPQPSRVKGWRDGESLVDIEDEVDDDLDDELDDDWEELLSGATSSKQDGEYLSGLFVVNEETTDEMHLDSGVLANLHSYPGVKYDLQREIVKNCGDDDPCSSEQVIRDFDVIYPPFVLEMPRFAHPDQREAYFTLEAKQNARQKNDTLHCPPFLDLCSPPPNATERYVVHSPQFTRGKILSLKNMAISGGYEACGVKSNWKSALSEGVGSTHVSEVLNLHVPQSQAFQHTLDGSIPKLMQWLDFIGDDCKLYAAGVTSKQVSHIYELLGFPPDRLIATESMGRISADTLNFGCLTPGTNPYLWRRMNMQFGVRDVPLSHRKLVLYLSRNHGSSNGRSVRNEADVLNVIKAHLEARGRGEFLVVFLHTEYTLRETRDLFNSAHAVIGPHGGAMYNAHFSAPGTRMMEFFPYDFSKQKYAKYGGVPGHMARFLDFQYWHFATHVSGGRDIHVRLDWLQIALDEMFPLG